jgi:hypothetical protein
LTDFDDFPTVDSSADPIDTFRAAQDAAVLEVADQGLLTLANLVESGAIDVSPKFQRRDRWNAEKQSRLSRVLLVQHSSLPAAPRVGEFVYFVVNAGLVNVLPDITAHSPAVRMLFAAIMLSGVAILGRYASDVWGGGKP